MSDDKKIEQIERELARSQAGKDNSVLPVKLLKQVLAELKAVKRQNTTILQVLKKEFKSTYVVSYDLHMVDGSINRVKTLPLKASSPESALAQVSGARSKHCDNYSVEEVNE